MASDFRHISRGYEGLGLVQHDGRMPAHHIGRRRAYARGIDAEAAACACLVREGWTVLGRRLRTEAGEIDVVAAKDELLAIVEVKARRTLAEAAFSLGARQKARLLAAAEIVLAEHPEWARAGMRFDLLLVDGAGTIRRIADAFRLEN